DGLALTTKTSFEPVGGSGYLRRLTKHLPAAVKAAGSGPLPSADGLVLDYYSEKQTLAEGGLGSVCGLPSTTPQSGLVKTSTSPVNSYGYSTTTQFVYDNWGR